MFSFGIRDDFGEGRAQKKPDFAATLFRVPINPIAIKICAPFGIGGKKMRHVQPWLF